MPGFPSTPKWIAGVAQGTATVTVTARDPGHPDHTGRKKWAELNARVAIVGLLTILALTGCETATESAPEDPQGFSYGEMNALMQALYDGILDRVYREPLLEAVRGATRRVPFPLDFTNRCKRGGYTTFAGEATTDGVRLPFEAELSGTLSATGCTFPIEFCTSWTWKSTLLGQVRGPCSTYETLIFVLDSDSGLSQTGTVTVWPSGNLWLDVVSSGSFIWRIVGTNRSGRCDLDIVIEGLGSHRLSGSLCGTPFG